MKTEQFPPARIATKIANVSEASLKLWRKVACAAIGRTIRAVALNSKDYGYYIRDLRKIAAIPDQPKDGIFTDATEKEWGTQAAMLNVGLLAPSQHKDYSSPLGRGIRTLKKVYRVPGRGIVCVTLFSVDDARAILAAKEVLPTAPAWPTVIMAAKQSGMSHNRLRALARSGKIRSEIARAPFLGKNTSDKQHIVYRSVLTICPDDVAALKLKVQGRPEPAWRRTNAETITLGEAASRSGIAYETWYWWTRQDICIPLGRKLPHGREARTIEDGRERDVVTIRAADYQAIVDKLALGRTPRIARLKPKDPAPTVITIPEATPLSARELDLLDALFDMNALKPELRASMEDVVRLKLKGCPSTYLAKVAAKLKRRGLVLSQVGSGGGLWLTHDGQIAVVNARK